MDKSADPIVFGPEYDPLARPRTPQTDSSTAPVVSRPRTDDTQLIDGRTGPARRPPGRSSRASGVATHGDVVVVVVVRARLGGIPQQAPKPALKCTSVGHNIHNNTPHNNRTTPRTTTSRLPTVRRKAAP